MKERSIKRRSMVLVWEEREEKGREGREEKGREREDSKHVKGN